MKNGRNFWSWGDLKFGWRFLWWNVVKWLKFLFLLIDYWRKLKEILENINGLDYIVSLEKVCLVILGYLDCDFCCDGYGDFVLFYRVFIGVGMVEL